MYANANVSDLCPGAMRIGITGASGFVGRAVAGHARRRGHEIIAFSRDPSKRVRDAVETRLFSLDAPPDLGECEAIIHLAGEPILGFWTANKRRAIVASRVQGTRRIVEAIAALDQKPEVLVAASAIGFYGNGGDSILDESAPQGGGFLAETTAAWEKESLAATEVLRVVPVRIAVVLGRGGGALRVMEGVFRAGLGGVIGSGAQWMSWIHIEDLARLMVFAVEDLDVRGPINASAPWPVPHREFVKTLARIVRRPAWFGVPAFAVRTVLRGLADELLESKRVVPSAATDAGFDFKFPELEPALCDILR
jgi:uncharacterized protein (TIGR01777 family)